MRRWFSVQTEERLVLFSPIIWRNQHGWLTIYRREEVFFSTNCWCVKTPINTKMGKRIHILPG